MSKADDMRRLIDLANNNKIVLETYGENETNPFKAFSSWGKVSEAGMPASVIKSKEKIRYATDEENKQRFAGKTLEELRSMAWRHGYGKDSKEYDRFHDGVTGVTVSEGDLLTFNKKKSEHEKYADAFSKQHNDEHRHGVGWIECTYCGDVNCDYDCDESQADGFTEDNQPITDKDHLDEDLHKWFKEKWVRFGPDGKIRGDCAREKDSEGKPKCLPQSKAHSVGKKARASAASRKRRKDPNADRSGKAINVNTKKKKSNESLRMAEGGAETSWSDDTETITLQDILEITKHIKQINLPINDNLKSKLLHWDGNPEEIERINHVIASTQFPILIMVDEQGQIEYILDGNHRLHKAIRSQEKTIPAKLIKPSDLNDKAKRVFRIKEQGMAEENCPHCGGPMYHESMINEKQDACYRKVKSRYKVWPSAYASGALVQCRKKGAKNWGNKSESVEEAMKPEHVTGKEKSGAVEMLEKRLLSAKKRGAKLDYDSIDRMMQRICDEYNLTGDKLHNDFVKKHHLVPDKWIVKQVEEAANLAQQAVITIKTKND